MLDKAIQILMSLINDIEAVGGVVRQDDGNYGLVIDPEWYDLADTYHKAKSFMEAYEGEQTKMFARKILEQQRDQDAQRAYELFDFGEATVEDQDGWQHIVPGDTYTRFVYLTSDSDQPSHRVTFTVRFKPDTTEILFAGV